MRHARRWRLLRKDRFVRRCTLTMVTMVSLKRDCSQTCGPGEPILRRSAVGTRLPHRDRNPIAYHRGALDLVLDETAQDDCVLCVPLPELWAATPITTGASLNSMAAQIRSRKKLLRNCCHAAHRGEFLADFGACPPSPSMTPRMRRARIHQHRGSRVEIESTLSMIRPTKPHPRDHGQRRSCAGNAIPKKCIPSAIGWPPKAGTIGKFCSF